MSEYQVFEDWARAKVEAAKVGDIEAVVAAFKETLHNVGLQGHGSLTADEAVPFVVADAFAILYGAECNVRIPSPLLAIGVPVWMWRLLAVHPDRVATQQAFAQGVARLAYVKSRPTRYDLFTHMSARERFLIDGDSILLEALGNRLVRWDLLQPLHVVYVAERFLSDLLKRGARFHVVFFDTHRSFWSETPQFLAARELLKARLEAVAAQEGAEFEVSTFASWAGEAGEAFKEFVDDKLPEFVLHYDGEGLLPGHESLQMEPASEEGLMLPVGKGREVYSMFRLFSLFCFSRRLHVAFTSRFSLQGATVLAFVIRASSARFIPAGRASSTVEARAVALFAASVLPRFDAAAEAAAAKLEAVTDAELPLWTRDIPTLAAIADVAKADKAMVPVAKLHVAAVVLCRALTLHERALKRVQCAELKPYLDAFAAALAPMVAPLTQSYDADEKCVDMWDGNLLAMLGMTIKGGKPASELFDASAESLSDTWGFVASAAGLSGSDASIETLPDLAGFNFVVVPALDAEQRQREDEITVSDGTLNPLVKAVLPDDEEAIVTPPVAGAPSVFWEDGKMTLKHLDEPRGVAEQEYMRKNIHNFEKNKRRMAERLINRFLQAITKTAESMHIEPFLSTNEMSCIANADDGKTKKVAAHAEKARKAAGNTLSKADKIARDNRLRKAVTGVEAAFRETAFLISRKDVKGLAGFAESGMKAYSLASNDEGADPPPLEVWRQLSGADEADFALPAVRNARTPEISLEPSMKAIDAFVLRMKGSAAAPILKNVTDAEETALLLRATLFKNGWAHIVARVRMTLLRLAKADWMAEISSSNEEDRELEMESAVPLFQQLHSVIDHLTVTHTRIPQPDRLEIRQCLRLLKFPAAYEKRVEELEVTSQGSPFSTDASIDPTAKLRIPAGHNAIRFQLCRMGHLLPRPTGKAVDPRVPFRPDPWQADLLDIVDKNGSAVVCAPTSAGKTFISYYCMKKVLKESNDAMVLYVCPTRSLVNQALADIYGRYGQKSYPNDFAVMGCLAGSEFVRQPFRCQVLVTLPEALEPLLLSSEYQDFARRIRYVIFDEIHSIEESVDGDVWERLLSLIRCPFVALSATLGKTDNLLKWLNRVQSKVQEQEGEQASRDYRVHLLPKKGQKIQRWNDLVKYAYLPKQRIDIDNLVDRAARKLPLAAKNALIDIHPMSCVTLGMIQDRFPEDLPFVPRETVDVFEVMTEVYMKLTDTLDESPLVSHLDARIARLKPERYFKAERVISQTHARQYEQEMKLLLELWGRLSKGNYGVAVLQARAMPDVVTDEEADAIEEQVEDEGSAALKQRKAIRKGLRRCIAEVMEHYGSGVRSAEAAVEEAAQEEAQGVYAKQGASTEDMAGAASAAPEPVAAAIQQRGVLPDVPFPDTTQYVQRNILSLIMTLRAKGRLPAIVFTFEEHDCSELVECLVTQLEEMEAEYRTTPQFDAWRREREKKAAQQAKNAARSKTKRKATVDEDGRRVEEDDAGENANEEQEDYSIPDVLPQFSFLPEMSRVPRSEMQEAEETFARVDPLLARALKRGIGMHSAAVRGGLRISIERFFRLEAMPLVFATQSLALGIHSPCRSVVLAGDHVLLNVTQFRQMAGRAGRRGLDYLGHVVFLGVGYNKIQRLMTSELSSLNGHVHVNPITELRLLQLHSEAADKSESEALHAQRVAKCLLTRPLFRFGADNCDYQRLLNQHFAAMAALFVRERLHFPSSPSTTGSFVTRCLHSFQQASGSSRAIAFGVLFNSGVLQRAARGWEVEANRPAALEKVIDVLVALFACDSRTDGPMEIHRSVMEDPTVFRQFPRVARGVPHEVVMKPVKAIAGGDFHRAVQKYNTRVLAAMRDMMVGLSRSDDLDSTQRDKLPLTPEDSKKLPCAKKLGKDPIAATFAEESVAVEARSPFVAAGSGMGDIFTSTDDLLHSLRSGLYIDARQVPTVEFSNFQRHDGEQVPQNAIITDWLESGSQMADGKHVHEWLRQYNGLPYDQSWGALSRFVKTMDNVFETIDVDEDLLAADDPLRPMLREIIGHLAKPNRHEAIWYSFIRAKLFKTDADRLVPEAVLSLQSRVKS